MTRESKAGFPTPFDGFREECGIFGVFGTENAAAITALGLHALQHRGQEAAGIVSFDGTQFFAHRAQGRVGDAFGSDKVIGMLPGNASIGHNRYSTSGAKTQLRDVQPIFAEVAHGGVAIAHNGNLTNARTLKRNLVQRGCIFQSTMDTEVIVHLVATASGPTFLDRLIEALYQVEGAYSLIALSETGIIGARDPNGVRPLVLGELHGQTVLASETCALDIIGATFTRSVAPGEIVHIDRAGVRSLPAALGKAPRAFCIFEYIYFARPDSVVEDKNVYAVRQQIGRLLARDAPADADIVVPVPDSGVPAALGYADQAGLPFELGIIRNHYVGRTFIEPTDEIRHLGVRLKHNVNADAVGGKRVVLVDDSIVRGTTSTKIVEMLRTNGAREVHMRIASPPTTHPCYYGVDTPKRNELIAAHLDENAIAAKIGADSLRFVRLESLFEAVHGQRPNGRRMPYCAACFTGDYPIELIDDMHMELPLLLEET